ncbi:hypothetical protein EBU58_12080 [bacterium]|nr:hypothetical protein [bacterium]
MARSDGRQLIDSTQGVVKLPAVDQQFYQANAFLNVERLQTNGRFEGGNGVVTAELFLDEGQEARASPAGSCPAVAAIAKLLACQCGSWRRLRTASRQGSGQPAVSRGSRMATAASSRASSSLPTRESSSAAYSLTLRCRAARRAAVAASWTAASS